MAESLFAEAGTAESSSSSCFGNWFADAPIRALEVDSLPPVPHGYPGQLLKR